MHELGHAAAQQPIDIGPIRVAGDWITGPQGQIPAAGSRISISNQTMTREAIPTWAIVCAIVGFFVLTVFSLLFLLAKEQRVEGVILIRAQAADGRMLEGGVPVTQQNFGWAWSDLSSRAHAANAMLATRA